MIFSDIQKSDIKFKCDGCKKVIMASDIILSECVDNIDMKPMIITFKYIDKDGKITGGSEQPSKEKGDMLLTCPHCEQVHLFGMDSI